jgi:hypothetical protein
MEFHRLCECGSAVTGLDSIKRRYNIVDADDLRNAKALMER